MIGLAFTMKFAGCKPGKLLGHGRGRAKGKGHGRGPSTLW